MHVHDHLTRRRLLAHLGVLGGGALVASAGIARAATAVPLARGVIDVHHHVASPSWLGSGGTPQEALVFKGWSVETTLAQMDAAGVSTAYVSFTVPGHRFDDAASARRVSRDCNQYMADLRAQHPGRFGFFALVPMPNEADTLAEIAYAYDTLKADGIGLFTSYGAVRVGDKSFDPVFAELNRRNAVVFVHPSSSACCGTTQPILPTAYIEFGTDTTRTIAEYIINGGTQKFPNVKMIWSHAGGTMPYLIERFIDDSGPTLPAQMNVRVPTGFVTEARKCYYDTAQIPSRGAMLALREMVPPSQILFGTDYPYKAFDWTEKQLIDGKAFNARELQSVYRDNAVAMFRKS
jgi:predicted TIM-barrel fold metal-dependent hydrolase